MTCLYSDPIYRSVLTEFQTSEWRIIYTQKYVFLENLLFIVAQSNKIIKLSTVGTTWRIGDITIYLQSYLQRLVDFKCLCTERTYIIVN